MRKFLLLNFFCLSFVGMLLCPFAYSENHVEVLNVYYLYGNPRCPSCQKIESYTRRAIEENFDKELASGEIVFRALNTDLDENKHYIKDYGLYTKSVVLSLVQDGEEITFKNLEKVWSLLMNEEAFMDYVLNEVNEMRASLA